MKKLNIEKIEEFAFIEDESKKRRIELAVSGGMWSIVALTAIINAQLYECSTNIVIINSLIAIFSSAFSMNRLNDLYDRILDNQERKEKLDMLEEIGKQK